MEIHTPFEEARRVDGCPDGPTLCDVFWSRITLWYDIPSENRFSNVSKELLQDYGGTTWAVGGPSGHAQRLRRS